MDQHASKHVEIRVRDHGIERVLQERLEPSPEQPLHFRNNEKWDEDWPKQYRNGRGDVAEGDHEEHRGFEDDNHRHDQNEVEDSDDVKGDDRDLEREINAIQAREHIAHDSVVELIGNSQAFVGDQVMKAYAEAWNRMRVIGDHGKTESNREQELGEVIQTEPWTSTGRR